MTTVADPQEAREFLARHPDVQSIELVITDPSGVARGKAIAREELEPFFASGRAVAGSILGLDITGEDVEETGLVWSAGDADQMCRPVAGTLVPAPWLKRPGAQVLMSMYGMDGRTAIADPRHVLARNVASLQAAGYTPVVAVELEFYLLGRSASGDWAPAAGLLSGRAPARLDAYGLGKLEDMAPVFDAIYEGAARQGLPLRTLMSEYAPGQYEITLAHRADALRAVDDAILFKRLVKGVAARHGLTACFMAKPFEQHAGSGMHLHLSLQDQQGTNVFASDDPAGSALLRHAIGGLRTTMAESMLVFAPNANSYRRFQRLSYAPMTPTWGINNRSVSLRIPSGPAQSRHVEHRVSGADANPYLAIAAVLAAAGRGIAQRLDPGPPSVGNAYAASADALPGDWWSAITGARQSAFLQAALGEEFLRVFLAIKVREYNRFQARVSEVDYQWYLDTV